MNVVPANCRKTFLLLPLKDVFKAFVNPSNSSFAWVGAEQAEVIFLNDFRWSHQVISWNDFLLLLEGEDVHLPTPKSHFSKDVLFDKDSPIFATSKHERMLIRNGTIDERETKMMRVRWRIFTLYSQIRESEQVDVPPCGKCFASFVLGSPVGQQDSESD